MKNIEPTNQSRNKAIYIISVLLTVIIVGGLSFYAFNQNQESKNKISKSITNIGSSTDQSPTSSSSDQTISPTTSSNNLTRDPNRYYNDADGYSFIVPESYQVRKIQEVPGYEDNQDGGLALDTSFDYKFSRSDDLNSNPDIRIISQIDPDGQIDRIQLDDSNTSQDCQKLIVKNLDIIECKIENQLLGGKSREVYFYRDNQVVFLSSHDSYDLAINKIVQSFEWQ